MLTTYRALKFFCYVRHTYSLRHLKPESASKIFNGTTNDLQRRLLQTHTKTKSRGASMRFVQFQWNGRLAVGVEETEGGDIIDVTEIDPNVPHNMRDFIAGGQNNLLAAKK
jgi:hypothetical protein